MMRIAAASALLSLAAGGQAESADAVGLASLALLQPGEAGTGNAQRAAALLHRHPAQRDGAVLAPADARALVARVVGGLEVDSSAISAHAPAMPVPDVFRRPRVVVSVVVEGTATGVTDSQLQGRVLGAFGLSSSAEAAEKVPFSRGVELVAAASAHRAALDAKSPASLSVSASASAPHLDASCAGRDAVFGAAGAAGQDHRCSSFAPGLAPMRDVRGTDDDVLSRLGALVRRSNAVAAKGGKAAGLSLLDGDVTVRVSEETGRAFLEELDTLAALLPRYLASDVCGKPAESAFATPVSVASTLSTLDALSRAEGWSAATTSGVSASAIGAVMEGWRRACGGSDDVLGLVFSGVEAASPSKPVVGGGGGGGKQQQQEEGGEEAVTASSRRLLAETETSAAQAGKGTVYSMHEIATYQIKLGSGLALAFALLMSVCLFCGSTMQYTDDSLLFGGLAFKQDNKDL